MSIFRTLLDLLPGIRSPAAPEPRMTDAERLARAVLGGDEEAALLLADEVLMTYRRVAGVPQGVVFKSLAWPTQARKAFYRRGVTSFRRLLEVSADEMLDWDGVGPKTLQRVRAILAGYGLSLKGDPDPTGGER